MIQFYLIWNFYAIIYSHIIVLDCNAIHPLSALTRDNSKVWEHLLAALVSFSSVAVNARGRLCSLGTTLSLSLSLSPHFFPFLPLPPPPPPPSFALSLLPLSLLPLSLLISVLTFSSTLPPSPHARPILSFFAHDRRGHFPHVPSPVVQVCTSRQRPPY